MDFAAKNIVKVTQRGQNLLGQPSYTVEKVRQLKALYHDGQLSVLCNLCVQFSVIIATACDWWLLEQNKMKWNEIIGQMGLETTSSNDWV